MKKFETLGRSLSKADQKKILGGADEEVLPPEDGECSAYDKYCNTSKYINCCTGYVCANYKCSLPTA